MKKPIELKLFLPPKWRLSIVLICLFSLVQFGFSWKDPWRSSDLSFTLDRSGDLYLFRASVFIKSEPTCVLETIYLFYHLQQLLKEDADVVKLLRQEKDHYDVRLVHKGKLYVIDTVYRRSLQKDKKRVAFELLETKQEGRMIPKILSSKGYYELETVKGGVKVNYFEETRIATARWDPRSAGLVEVVERDTLSFLKNLKKYAEQTACRQP